MVIKSYLDIDFSSRIGKRWIQRFFYMSSKLSNDSVLMLCGPDIISHYNDYKLIGNRGTSKLYIAELDTKTYEQNVKDLQKINNLKYSIVNDDIINCRVKKFVDLDFCKFLESTIHIVAVVYKKMLNLKTRNNSRNRHLLITFSINRSGIFNLESDIESLCILFGISNDFVKHSDFPNSNIMRHKTADCMYSTYRDGTPMCTFSYQFK